MRLRAVRGPWLRRQKVLSCRPRAQELPAPSPDRSGRAIAVCKTLQYAQPRGGSAQTAAHLAQREGVEKEFAFFAFAIMLSLMVFIFEGIRDAFDPRKTFR